MSRVTTRDPRFEFMEYSKKIDADKSLGILDARDSTALQAVGSMRNKFAHRLNRVLT